MKLHLREHNQVSYQYIQTNQFKSRIITVRFLAEIDKLNVTARSLMISMLKAKNAKYPTRKAQSKYLESLYDAIYHAGPTKLASRHISQISMVVIDDKYAMGQPVFEDALNFLNTAIFQPRFDEKTLQEEKQFLKDYFNAEFANKARYAGKRYAEHLYHDYPYKANALGELKAIDKVTLEDIEATYQNMIKENQVYVTVIAPWEIEPTHQQIVDYLPLSSKPIHTPIIIRHPFDRKEPVFEQENVSQERFFITLKSDVLYRDKDYFTMLVLNALLGEGSDSLLFKHVRETHSLAYYVYSSYSPNTGLITLASAMKHENLAIGEAKMLECFEWLKTGNFSNEALSLAKKHIISQFKQSYDTPSGLSIRALRTALFKVPFKEDLLLDIIEAVGKEDITELAAQLHVIFKYRLGGAQNADDNIRTV